MRYCHLLKTCKAGSFPRHIFTVNVDGEWEDDACRPNTQTERMTGWIGYGITGASGEYSEPRRASGVAASSFWASLRNRLKAGGDAWVVACDPMRTFTLLNIWRMIEDGEAVLPGQKRTANRCGATGGVNGTSGICCVENPPFIIDLRLAGCAAKVKILGASDFGFDDNDCRGGKGSPSAHAIRALKQMAELCKSEMLGSLKTTASSQAMTAFRHSHMGDKIECHNNPIALGLEERSYVGGRCEALHLGRLPGWVWHLDVRAMYPSLYRSAVLPVCLVKTVDNESVADATGKGDGLLRISQVLLATPEAAYPMVDASSGRTIYPIGQFRTVLCGPELGDALDRGRILRVERTALYEGARCLDFYGNHMLEMRDREGVLPEVKQWAKALANCIVGKFGQREKRWEQKESDKYHDFWQVWNEVDKDGIQTRWRSIAGFTQREQVSGFAPDACPAIAAWICSLARIRLLEIIRAAGWRNVWYYDTDSVMVNRQGWAKLLFLGHVAEGEVGKLQVKGVHSDVRIYGIKSYSEDGKTVQAGIPISPVDREGDRYTYWTGVKAGGWCRIRSAPRPVRHKLAWRYSGLYKHGRRLVSGDVVPLEVWED